MLEKKEKSIKVFVTYKEKHQIIETDIVKPIQTGRAIADEAFEGMIGDDTGDNISKENDKYCELTAQYWAWKNYDKIGNPDYIGFMHYRRLLNFDNKKVSQLKDLKYTEKNVSEIIQPYDIIVSEKLGAYSKTESKYINTIKKHWSIEHNIKDIDFIYGRTCSLFPEYKSSFDTILNTNKISWYNIFLMKKEIYYQYCQWLFKILDVDVNNFAQPERIKGYLGEILLNVFIEKNKVNLKIKEFPIFRYQEPTRIPIAMTCSNEYVPYCATTMLSILKNTAPSNKIHFYILTTGIKKYNQNKLKKLGYKNYDISFINVSIEELSIFDEISFSEHVGKMSFVRLLLPEFIKNEKKVIFIDCDTLVLGDIGELYKIDLNNNFFGAVEDVNKFEFGYNLNFDYYTNGYVYVNAGVLLVDIYKLKSYNYKAAMIECCKQNLEIYECSDQDLLNDTFKGRIKILPTKWNLHHNFHHYNYRFVPLDDESYKASCKSPAIIHFVGPSKPWMENCKNPYQNLYLGYFKETPFFTKYKINRLFSSRFNFLQTLFSIKNKNNHKILTIVGLKIKFKNLKKDIDLLKWQLKKVIDENKLYKFSSWQYGKYITAHSLTEAFIKSRDHKVMLDICTKYFADKKLKFFPNTELLIYIICLLENNCYEKAKNLLYSYISLHGNYDIWRFLPVAKFARELGFSDYKIERASLVFDKLEEHRKQDSFIKLLKNKNVAIVGNAPSEIGKNKGEEIDSADLVIRINNYQITGYEKDYGSKTDIWIRGFGAQDIKDYTKSNKYQFAGIAGDYIHIPLYWAFQLENLYRDLVIENIQTGYISPYYYQKLRSEYDLDPTTGFSTIYTLLNTISPDKIKFYGFSFLQEREDGYATHYFNDRSDAEAKKMSINHSFTKESCIIRELLTNVRNDQTEDFCIV